MALILAMSTIICKTKATVFISNDDSLSWNVSTGYVQHTYQPYWWLNETKTDTWFELNVSVTNNGYVGVNLNVFSFYATTVSNQNLSLVLGTPTTFSVLGNTLAPRETITGTVTFALTSITDKVSVAGYYDTGLSSGSPISTVLYMIPEYSVLSIIIVMVVISALAIVLRERDCHGYRIEEEKR